MYCSVGITISTLLIWTSSFPLIHASRREYENERFDIKAVNRIEAPGIQKSLLDLYGQPFPFLLDTMMRLPFDVERHGRRRRSNFFLSNNDLKHFYAIRTTLILNTNDDGKVFSVVYDSDYRMRGYADIQNYFIEENATDAIRISRSTIRRRLSTNWRVSLLPGGYPSSARGGRRRSNELGLTVILEDPDGRIYVGRDTLECESLPGDGGTLCVKKIIPLSGG